MPNPNTKTSSSSSPPILEISRDRGNADNRNRYLTWGDDMRSASSTNHAKVASIFLKKPGTAFRCRRNPKYRTTSARLSSPCTSQTTSRPSGS